MIVRRIEAQVSKTCSGLYGGSDAASTSSHQASTNASTAEACSAGQDRQSTRLSPCGAQPTSSKVPSAIACAHWGSRRRMTAVWSSKWPGTSWTKRLSSSDGSPVQGVRRYAVSSGA